MKKIVKLFTLLSVILCVSGCLKRDNMENITIYTTNYPTEYITSRLYGEYSTIYSIYPDGVYIEDYKLTNKQLKDYSESDLFIFNGLSNEGNYVTKMRKYNKNLKIIDTTLSMEYNNGMEELWLDPSNFLMLAQNIKTGFKEYINNFYLNNIIDENYEKLKIEASNLDAKIKEIVSTGDSKAIVASDNVFKYLEKYGLTVYSLDESNPDIDRTRKEVKNLINEGKIKYIFVKPEEDLNSSVQGLLKTTDVEVKKWNMLSNISELERTENKDYFSLMNDNLELLKQELYK